MDVETRLELVARPPTEEIIVADELRELLETNEHPRHYIGFEISGPLHLGSLFVAGYKIRDFIEAGFETTVFLADWHSYINDKLGGDWDRIRRAARYYADAFRQVAPGVRVVTGSELYSRTPEYWGWIVRIAKRSTVSRLYRTLTIMGRKAGEAIDAAQLVYPLMQAADIRALEVDVAHAGIDQRKVHMLARDVFSKLGWRKPVAVHHHLLAGLQEPRAEGFDEDPSLDLRISSKMSKSKPDSAVFIHDSREDIERKILKAWCPQKVVENNPVLEIVKYVIFKEKEKLRVERPSKYGGDAEYGDYESLEADYAEGKLHPLDLKRAVARELDSIIDPVRRRIVGDKGYFEVLGKEI